MKKFLLLFAVGLLALTTQAQTDLNDFSFRVFYKTTSTDTLVFDSLCNRICEVDLPFTNGIASIHVKVGTTDGANDILQHNFVFDQTQGLPQGLSYLRNNKKVRLGLLQTYKADLYFYEVQLEKTNGQLSVVKKWH